MTEALKTKEVFNYSSKAAEKPVMSCPRCMNDVYSLGISLNYYIGNLYLQLADSSQGEIKTQYEKLALKQLDDKEQIENLIKIHTNELLCYFYNNGGPIIEPPLSEEAAKEKQPFFNRVVDNFFVKLEASNHLTSSNIMNPDELENLVNASTIELYTNLAKLIQVEEIVKAFNELIKIINAAIDNQ